MDNNVINLKRIPFIPKLSRNFKPMKHYLCETDTSAKAHGRQRPHQVFLCSGQGRTAAFAR